MITSLLSRHFGFDRLRPGQEAVISPPAGRQECGRHIFRPAPASPSCYQLPALALPLPDPGDLAPDRLMHDQLAFFAARIAAATLDSSQTPEESRRVMRAGQRWPAQDPGMISVERLKNERFRRFIAQIPCPPGGGRGALHLGVGSQLRPDT